MKDAKQIFYWIGLGMSLIIYAHATFATKDEVRTIHDDVKIIQSDVKELLKR
jgi:hypothetical protein